MFPLHEPSWGIELLLRLHQWMLSSDVLVFRTPLVADVFVFVYPVYLVILYLYGVYHRHTAYKTLALYTGLSTFFAVCVNILIQSFVMKERPDVALSIIDSSRDSLLLNEYLPTSTFPSDHAGVSMAIAMATLAWGLYHKKPLFTGIGVVFVIISLLMSIARIMVGVHWPTDIIMGLLVGCLVPLFFLWRPCFARMQKWLIQPLIRLQVWIWNSVGLEK